MYFPQFWNKAYSFLCWVDIASSKKNDCSKICKAAFKSGNLCCKEELIDCERSKTEESNITNQDVQLRTKRSKKFLALIRSNKTPPKILFAYWAVSAAARLLLKCHLFEKSYEMHAILSAVFFPLSIMFSKNTKQVHYTGLVYRMLVSWHCRNTTF